MTEIEISQDISREQVITTAPPRHLPQMAAWWGELQDAARAGVDEYTRLLPPPVLQAIIAEAETPRQPASRELAAELASLVIGSYPSHRNVGDPAIYARAITSLFTEHAPDVGREAVEIVTRSLRYLPSRAELHMVLEQIECRRRAAVAAARAMLREHERRERLRRLEEERARDPIGAAEWQDLRRSLGLGAGAQVAMAGGAR